MEENKKDCINQEQIAAIVKVIFGESVQGINLGKVNNPTQPAQTQQEKTATEEESMKNTTKTLKQIDEEMESNIGKKRKIKTHPQLKDGLEVKIIGFSRDWGKYILFIDDFTRNLADYGQVEIIENKWQDIHIGGYNTLGFDEYSIIIQQDCIKVIGIENVGAFNESKYTRIINDQEIIKACVKNMKAGKEKINSYLLNSLLRDKYYKEYHEISEKLESLRQNKSTLESNIDNNTNVIKSLEKELGI